MWFVWLVEAAFACSTAMVVYDFDDWVDGAVGVPTDARIVTLGFGTSELTLTRLDTGEVLTTTGELILSSPIGHARVAHTPEVELAPATTYRADVLGGYDEPLSATFTTGDGPTPELAHPVLGPLQARDWEPSGWFQCTLGNPIVERTVTGTVTLPDVPVGSYIAVSSGAGWFDLVGPATPGDAALDILQGQHAGDYADESPPRDCVTLTLVLPSGDELVSDEVCAEIPEPEPASPEPPAAPLDSGCECTSRGPGNLASVGLLALVAVFTRRSAGAAQAATRHTTRPRPRGWERPCP